MVKLQSQALATTILSILTIALSPCSSAFPVMKGNSLTSMEDIKKSLHSFILLNKIVKMQLSDGLGI